MTSNAILFEHSSVYLRITVTIGNQRGRQDIRGEGYQVQCVESPPRTNFLEGNKGEGLV
jgi:hypothetical protein